MVKKRAALALLRLIRKTAPEQQVVTADVFSPILNQLLEERDIGLLLSAATLLQGICARNGAGAGQQEQQGGGGTGTKCGEAHDAAVSNLPYMHFGLLFRPLHGSGGQQWW